VEGSTAFFLLVRPSVGVGVGSRWEGQGTWRDGETGNGETGTRAVPLERGRLGGRKGGRRHDVGGGRSAFLFLMEEGGRPSSLFLLLVVAALCHALRWLGETMATGCQNDSDVVR